MIARIATSDFLVWGGGAVERPVLVTVTCWVIIALGIEAIIGLISGMAEASLKEMLHSVPTPLSFSTTILSVALLSLANIALALLMLRGFNWARIVYLTISAILLLCMLAMHSFIAITILVVTVAKLAIFGILLFRPASNQFFLQ